MASPNQQLRGARGPSRTPDPGTVGWRLRTLRTGAKMSQEDVADHVGTTAPTLSRYETNDLPTPDPVADRLARLFKVTPAYIRYGDTSSRIAMVVGYVGAGAEVHLTGEHVDLGGVEVPASWTDAIALQVRGDSGLPLYADGGILVIRGDQRLDEREFLRRMAILELKDGRGLVKEARRSAEPGRYDLWSPNAAPIEAVEVVSARPVKAYFPPE